MNDVISQALMDELDKIALKRHRPSAATTGSASGRILRKKKKARPAEPEKPTKGQRLKAGAKKLTLATAGTSAILGGADVVGKNVAAPVLDALKKTKAAQVVQHVPSEAQKTVANLWEQAKKSVGK